MLKYCSFSAPFSAANLQHKAWLSAGTYADRKFGLAAAPDIVSNGSSKIKTGHFAMAAINR